MLEQYVRWNIDVMNVSKATVSSVDLGTTQKTETVRIGETMCCMTRQLMYFNRQNNVAQCRHLLRLAEAWVDAGVSLGTSATTRQPREGGCSRVA